MLTADKVDKHLADMTDEELSEIINACRHDLHASLSRCRHLASRMNQSQAERDRRTFTGTP